MTLYLNQREKKLRENRNNFKFIVLGTIILIIYMLFSHKQSVYFKILERICFYSYFIVLIRFYILYLEVESKPWWQKIIQYLKSGMYFGLGIMLLFTCTEVYRSYHFNHFGINKNAIVVETGTRTFSKFYRYYTIIQYSHKNNVYLHQHNDESYKYKIADTIPIVISDIEPEMLEISNLGKQ